MGRNAIEKELVPVDPERFVVFQRPDGTELGYLAVDTTTGGVCGGGVLAVPEISRLELCHLAMAMTRKYAFPEIPVGGAKAAVLTRSDGADKKNDLIEFGKQLRPHTRSYSPGKDLGVDHRDLQRIFAAVGIQPRRTVSDSGFYTGFTVLLAAKESTGYYNMKLDSCTVAIEGFGSVGSWVARFLYNRGCRVVAASTRQGAVYNPKGIDVYALCRLRDRYGARCVTQYGDVNPIPKENLLRLSVDILSPCALSWSIRKSNADQVSAQMIIPGANNPVTDAAKKQLAARGIFYFPDFVANCGCVLGSMFESAFLSPPRVLEMINRKLRPRIRHLFQGAGGAPGSLESLAETVAAQNLIRLHRGSRNPLQRVYPLVWRAYRSGLIPDALIRRCAAIYLQAMIR